MAKAIPSSRYILHVVVALSQLLMEEGGLAEYLVFWVVPRLVCPVRADLYYSDVRM